MNRAVALAALLLASPAPAVPTLGAVRVGHLFTGTEVLEPGVVVLAGGKVSSVSKSLPAGTAGRVVDLPGAWATPGWIDAASTTGLEGADAEMTREVTPTVRPLRAFDPGAPAVRRAREAGVTAIFLGPGSANVVGGICSVVKTAPGAGGAARVLRAEAALKVSFGYDPSSGNFPARGIPATIYARRPTTRMGVLAVLRDAWLLGRLAGPRAEDGDLAALARAAAGEIPVRALARHAEDLRTVLRLREELGIVPVIEGAAEGYRVADRLAEAKIGCVAGPLSWPVSGRGPESTEPALDNAGALRRAGVTVALTAGGDAAGLRDQAALATRYGLGRLDALRAVTSSPALLCGVGGSVGALEAGKDGDLVIFDGDPLEPSTRVRLVVVDGEVVFEAEEAR